MANFIDFTNAAFDAMNTGAAITNNIIQNNAVISTRNKRYQLQDAVNKKLQEIQQSSNFENWNTDVANFYGQIKSSMSDKNSPYYCRNNLEAQQFQAILDESNVVVKEKVAQMTIAAQNEKDILDTNNSTDLIFQTYAGQEAYDRANEGYNLLFKKGAISRTQYEQQKDRNYLRAYGSMCDKLFNDSFEESLKHGETAETFWQKMKETLPELRATDASGMEKTLDISSYMDSQEKKYKSMYNARQQDMWNESEKRCAQIFDSVMDGATAEERNQARMLGRAYLDSVKYTGQMSPEQLTKWTNIFKLEEYKDGNGSMSSAQAAMNKLDPKDIMQWFLNSIKTGDPQSVYSSKEALHTFLMNELQKANPGMSWTALEMECPTIMEYLEVAKKMLPAEMTDVVNYAQNLLGTILNSKDDKNAYKNDVGEVLNVVYDMLFEADIPSFDATQKQAYKTRVARFLNSKYGNILDSMKGKEEYQNEYNTLKKEKFGLDAISGYQEGVTGNEKTLAQAIYARDNNPDMVYTDMYWKPGDPVKFTVGEDVQKGLTYVENAEKQRIADAIKYRTGEEIDVGNIPSQYESDGDYDFNARKVYTVKVDGVSMDFRFTSKDGKHVIMEEKPTGSKDWHESMSKKQNAKYDVETGIEQWKNGDTAARPPIKIDSYRTPGREMTSYEWNEQPYSFKKSIIKKWIKEDPKAALNWINKHQAK